MACETPFVPTEVALKEFLVSSIEVSRLASMIYGISKNHGEGVGCSETPGKKKQNPEESMKSSSYTKEEF